MTPEALKHSELTVGDLSRAVESYRALENRSPEDWQARFGGFFKNLPEPRQDERDFCGVDLETGCPFIVHYHQETGRPSTRFEVLAGERKAKRPVLRTVIDYSYGKIMKIEPLNRLLGLMTYIDKYNHPITKEVLETAQIKVCEARIADEDWRSGRKFGHSREVVILGKWPSDMEGPREMVVLEQSDFVPLNPGVKYPTFVEKRRTFPVEDDSVNYINLAALEGKTDGRMVLAKPEGKGKKGKIAGHKPPPDLGPARMVKH